MNKNTLNAINRRLSAGLKEFTIGDNRYRFSVTTKCLLHYNLYTGGLPILDGVVENGVLNPDRFI